MIMLGKTIPIASSFTVLILLKQALKDHLPAPPNRIPKKQLHQMCPTFGVQFVSHKFGVSAFVNSCGGLRRAKLAKQDAAAPRTLESGKSLINSSA